MHVGAASRPQAIRCSHSVPSFSDHESTLKGATDMNPLLITRLTVVLTLSLLRPSAAQELRSAVSASDLVVIAIDSGVRPLAPGILLHRLEIRSALKGEVRGQVSVLEHTTLSHHARPTPAETRLYCLHELRKDQVPAGLPEALSPFYKLDARVGGNPPLAAPFEADPWVELAKVVVAADGGLDTQRTADRLHALALLGKPGVRLEAVRMLTERVAAMGKLTPMQWSELVTRAVGELEDVPYKIALAELCAEKKLPALVDELCLSVDQVEDPRFAEALGRIAKVLHGDSAHEALLPALRRARSPETKGRLWLALGATSTEGAAKLLLEAERNEPRGNRWLEAALRLHGGKEASDALARRTDSRPTQGSRGR